MEVVERWWGEGGAKVGRRWGITTQPLTHMCILTHAPHKQPRRSTAPNTKPIHTLTQQHNLYIHKHSNGDKVEKVGRRWGEGGAKVRRSACTKHKANTNTHLQCSTTTQTHTYTNTSTEHTQRKQTTLAHTLTHAPHTHRRDGVANVAKW